MADDTTDKGESGDLAKYRDMADRRKRQLEEANASNAGLLERLNALEAKEQERAAKLETVEQDRLRKAGEFETIESNLTARITEIEAREAALTGEVDVYRSRTQAEIDAILDGNPEAEAIRADLEGLALDRQLSILKRNADAKDSGPVAGPGGQPRVPGHATATAALSPEQDAFAESQGWRTPEEKADFAARVADKATKRDSDALYMAGMTIVAPKAGE